MSFIYSIVGFLIAIGVLVAVHEFGHYWVAKKLGVKVLRFSVGFGKPLWTKIAGKDQTEYVLAAIPLGGYVKMLDEGEGEVAANERHRAFNTQPIWKRALIVVAGPAINFFFAIVAFCIIGLMSSQDLKPILGDIPDNSMLALSGVQSGDELVAIDGKAYKHFSQHDLYIFNKVLGKKDLNLTVKSQHNAPKTVVLNTHELPIYNISPSFITRTVGLIPVRPEITSSLNFIQAGSPAEKAGLKAGDKLLSIGSVRSDSWDELTAVVVKSPELTLPVVYLREGVQHETIVTPEAVDRDGKIIGRMGISAQALPYAESDKVTIKRSLLDAFKHGVEQTWLMSSVTLRSLWKMITLQMSHKNINGPITIAQVTGEAIQLGLDYYLHILAVISISLGVMNLLPIPMLDGGHLMMYVVEVFAGKSVSEKVFAVGQRVGIFFLLCLMSLAFYNDIFRLLN